MRRVSGGIDIGLGVMHVAIVRRFYCMYNSYRTERFLKRYHCDSDVLRDDRKAVQILGLCAFRFGR